MNNKQINTGVVLDYISALESGLVGEDLAPFFSDDVLQVEFPNLLNKDGQESDLKNILERSVQGKSLLSEQKYTILNELSQGNRVALEATWEGTLAISIGSLTPGSKLKAHFALFFELKEGRIFRQNNYDCFEPW